MNKPDIRFNGFNEEWTEKKYTEVFDTSVSNNTLSRAELTTEKTATKNVHYGDILIKYNSILDVKKDDFPFVPDEVKMDPRNFLKNGDIVFADTAEDETCGKATEINNLEHENVVAGLHTFVARPKNVFEEKYLGYFVNSPAYHNQLIPFMQGTKVTSISKSNIQKTSVKYPESAKQKKLGALFSQIDSLIASTQKEHDKLVALKKCMLQKMFPKKGSLVPEIRFEGFSGDWVEKKLGEVVQEFYNGKTPYRGSSEYWNGNVNWIASGDLNRGIVTKTAETITELGKNDNNLRILNKGTVVIAIMGLEAKGTRGNCGILGIESTINQACMAIIPSDELDSQFFFAWYKSVAEKYGTKYTQGTKQQNLNAKILADFDIKVPTVEEQQKISAYFQNLDDLISKQAVGLEKLKNVKKTLLGKMFV